MLILKGIEIFAWIMLVVGAIWVPIKFHQPHYQSHEQKALFILGILPGSVILIILGVYKNTHGDLNIPNVDHAEVVQNINTQIEATPLECGVIQAVHTHANNIELDIQFESSTQTRRFVYQNQGQNFQAQRRICIRQDSNISTHDNSYLKEVS